jgi:hypothetical protein
MKNVRVDEVNVGGGTLKVVPSATANDPAGASFIKTLAIAPGAQVDLSNNSLTIGYSGSSSPVASVRSMLRDGRLGSSSADSITRLGYADLAATTDVLVKFAYAGDANLDGDADGVDIGTWATNFTGELADGTGATRTWAQGDWDYDGDVDGIDAGLWAAAFTGELGGPGLSSVVVDDSSLSREAAGILQGLGITVVPEPSAIAFVLSGAACSLRRARQEGPHAWFYRSRKFLIHL